MPGVSNAGASSQVKSFQELFDDGSDSGEEAPMLTPSQALQCNIKIGSVVEVDWSDGEVSDMEEEEAMVALPFNKTIPEVAPLQSALAPTTPPQEEDVALSSGLLDFDPDWGTPEASPLHSPRPIQGPLLFPSPLPCLRHFSLFLGR